jgi:hypothetical protein
VHRHHAKPAIFVKLQETEIGLAKSRSILQHGLEDRLKLAG